jgi:predicted AAA+ superfamily ATPase
MLSFVKELIASQVIHPHQVVFIDFSLYAGETLAPALLLQNFKELYPEKEPFFIFDEIQDIANFREFVLYLYNLGYKIFLS